MVYQFKPTRLRLSDPKILDVELTDLVQFEEFKKKQNEKRRKILAYSDAFTGRQRWCSY